MILEQMDQGLVRRLALEVEDKKIPGNPTAHDTDTRSGVGEPVPGAQVILARDTVTERRP